MNKTIQSIAHLCDQHRFQEKLLFVTSYSVGHQIGEYLVNSGASWINLRVTTPTGYGEQLVGLDLNSAGIRLINSQERILIIEKLYRGNDPSGKKCSYFESAAEIPGILKCLGNAVHEMRMSAIDKRSIDPGAFIRREKGEELAWLLESYDFFLMENSLIDSAGLLGMAIGKLESGEITLKNAVSLVLSDVPFNPLEKKLIRLVGGRNLVIIGHTVPKGLDYPGRFFADPNILKDAALEPKLDIELLPWLFSASEAPGKFQDGTVSMFHALGESNEVREVFRRILKSEIPLDDVEIVITTADPYVSFIYEIATFLGVPTTFASGIPITYTRPGRALILYLKWQAEDFRASHLRRLFSGGNLDMGSLEPEGERPSATRSAALIRDAAVGWGRDRYSDRLKVLEDGYHFRVEEKKAEGEVEKASLAEQAVRKVAWLNSFIEKIMATVPTPDSKGTVSTRELFTGALDFLQRFCRTASEQDVVAKSRLADLLGSLVHAPSIPETPKEAAERIETIIEDISIGSSTPRPGHIHVSHYRSGGYSGRSHTYVVGLDQSKFPGALLQDPVILDVERERLDAEMILSSEILSENIYIMAKMLCSMGGQVTLSYSCRDLREDREIFPSSVMLGVYRLITPDRTGDYRALAQYLGEPVGFSSSTEGNPLNDWEWWLSQKATRYGTDSIHRSYPDLLAGDVAEENRGLEEFSKYDGWISSLEGEMDPLDGEIVLSCSRLESLAKCPFAFFLQYVLGIEPLEEMEKDLSRWLDPMQRGELLHEVFYHFMQELKERGERPGVQKHLKLLEKIAMKEINRWKEEVPPSTKLVFDREVEVIKQSLQIFLKDEEERCRDLEPCFFELSFGLGEHKSSDISLADPVEIKLKGSKTFKLRGRIDRVDRCGAHDYEVWDYKTGSAWGFKEQGYVNRGRHLQHALYALAAEILLRRKLDKKARVVRAGYFFPSPKGEGRRISKNQLEKEELYEVLDELFEFLRSGTFPYSPDKDPCGICGYPKVCGGPSVAVERCKLKIEADARLEPLKRLKKYA
jgi:ATP-dependent helicase/nuclease subunit B